nr:glycosyltransferase family 1 protein [Mariniflexile sp. TRM1-10]
MNYYRQIDKSKVQFDFLVHRKEKADFDEEIERLGGKIYRFDAINPLFPEKYYKSLRAFFKERPEYEIIHSHINTFSSFPLKIAKEFKIPCRIAHAHIAIEEIKLKDLLNNKESTKELIKKIIKLKLKKNIHKYASHYFSCGEKAGKWLFGNQTDFTIMNNAINANIFKFDKLVSAAYKKEFNLENKLVIGHVGRFNSQKNHSFLLQIFACLVKKKPNSILILVGDGELRKQIQKDAENLDIAEKLLFLGIRTDIPQLYQMFDVFVFPSFYEGLPVTLIEAQAAGIKILASDSITNEVSITKDIDFLSINNAPDVWADKILDKVPYVRKDNFDLIEKNGYDIHMNTNLLEDFYLKTDK